MKYEVLYVVGNLKIVHVLLLKAVPLRAAHPDEGSGDTSDL